MRSCSSSRERTRVRVHTFVYQPHCTTFTTEMETEQPEMEWTVAKTKYLIELYRTRPLLWCPKQNDYKNKHKRREALVDMSERLGVTKQEVDRKIKNLVGQFARERKKLVGKSPDGAEEGVRSTRWFAFKLLMFLKDRNPPETIDTTQSTYQEMTFIKSELDSEPEWDGSSQGNETFADIQPQSTATIPDNVFHTSGKKRKSVDERAEETYRIMDGVDEVKTQRDECDLYGELMACKLRKLPSDRVRRNVQHVLDGIMWEAELGKYDNYHQQATSPSFILP